jgi:carboxyl-terminal processing protease
MTTSQIARVSLLFFAFLVACGTTPGATTITEQSEIPDVPRAVRPAGPSCTGPTTALITDLRQMRDNTLINPNALSTALKAKIAGDPGTAVLPSNLQSLLYSTKAILNSFYYGYSQVNLDQLHKKYEGVFRQGRPQKLSTYKLKALNNPTIDVPMDAYLDEVTDLHTFYLRPSSLGYQQSVTGGVSQPTPDFGILDLITTPSGGAMLLDVQAGGPALNAGLRRGDTLLEVDGQVFTLKATTTSTYQGYFKILADAAAKPQAVTVKYKRAGATLTTSMQGVVLASGALPWGEAITNANGSFFYLRIPSFLTPGTANAVHALVSRAKAATVKGVIVDLRDNPGGSLFELIGTVGAFSRVNAIQKFETIDANDLTFQFAAGKVSYTDACKSDAGNEAIINPDEWTGKIAILETAYSASASEFFAQLLKPSGRATVIGEETAGVGNTFTYTLPITSGRAISVTAGRARNAQGAYLTPTVKPDIAKADVGTKEGYEALLAGNDLALNAAFQSLQ